MWFEELSDDEFDADIVNKYTTPTYHAHTQREARRNLSKAVIFSHEWKLKKTFSSLRVNAICKRQNRKNNAPPVWKLGEFYQYQRYTILRKAMNNLLSNTNHYKLNQAYLHQRGRTLARVFGGLLQNAQEEQNIIEISIKLAEKQHFILLMKIYLRRLKIKSTFRRQHRRALYFTDNFSALYHLQKGLVKLKLNKEYRKQQHVILKIAKNSCLKRRQSYALAALRFLNAKTACRNIQAKRLLYRKGCIESARLVLQVLYINIPAAGEPNSTTITLQKMKKATKNHELSLLKCGLHRLHQCIFNRGVNIALLKRVEPIPYHHVKNGIIYMSGKNMSHRKMYQRHIGLKKMFVLTRRTAAMNYLQKIAIQSLINKVTTRAFFKLHQNKMYRNDWKEVQIPILDEHATRNIKQRVLAYWLRSCTSSLRQNLASETAYLHTKDYRKRNNDIPLSYGVMKIVFMKKGRGMSTWLQWALRIKRLQRRRIEIAVIGKQQYQKVLAMKSMQLYFNTSSNHRRAYLLAHFFSRTRIQKVALMNWYLRTNSLVYQRNRKHLLFWKLWRLANGLQCWKQFLNSRRRKRCEWVQCQQQHCSDLSAMGTRLWIAAAGNRQQKETEIQNSHILQTMFLKWAQLTRFSLIARGVNPSMLENFTHNNHPSSVPLSIANSSQRYAHITPMLFESSLEAARIHATTVAAKYGIKSYSDEIESKHELPHLPSEVLQVKRDVLPTPKSFPTLAPSTPPPLHKAKPRTYLYDSEDYLKFPSSPVSVMSHASPTRGLRNEDGHEYEYEYGSTSPPPSSINDTRTKTKTKAKSKLKVELAHEIIKLVQDLKGSLL